MNLLEHLKNNPFVLAPMAGITDSSFRSYMREMGAGVVISELVSSNGIEFNGQKSLDLMRYQEIQRPIGIQLFGEDPETMASAAKKCEEMKADFVDINFGCPVTKVVKKGAGSACLKDPIQLRAIVRATKNALNIPLTIKIRTGWTFEMRNAHEIAQIAYDEGVTWVAIHGRDRAQGYSGLSDWEYIADVKAKSKIPIIGNGDILTAEQANLRLKESGCDGVMIGRGCLKNPWIFQESMALFQGKTFDPKARDYMTAFSRLKFHLEDQTNERIIQIQLRKFASWFSAGYPGSAKFRQNLFQTKSSEETLAVVGEFYDSIKGYSQEDTSGDGFLMGGHG